VRDTFFYLLQGNNKAPSKEQAGKS